MPFERYERMDPAKRSVLLQVATQEFATHGYEGASFNHILATARIAKSLAYYYFADKADLFCTVVTYCFDQLRLVPEPHLLQSMTAENYWTIFTTIRERPVKESQESSVLFGTIRAAEQLSPAARQHPSLAQLAVWVEEHLLAGMQSTIQRGQELGCVRTDLPDELLLAWLRQIDAVSDAWVESHAAQAETTTVQYVLTQTGALIKQALSPHAEPDSAPSPKGVRDAHPHVS